MTTTALYIGKPTDYFSGARRDMVEALPRNPLASILELGCGDGSTGALALSSGRAARYVGVELDPTAAQIARARLTDVLEGDVASLDLGAHLGQHDALIASEVFEHLVDPWAVLARLVACLKPGALVLASSPNVAHWRVISRLLNGEFTHTETGVMDRSHLRWFTPASYAALMKSAGLNVLSVAPITPPAPRTQLLNRVTKNRFNHLFMTQIYVTACKPGGIS